VAKRPRFSRWRRLPPVFRSGEHRPIGTGNELDRIILYLPSRLLDLAEVLAQKAGIPAIQDYCARLLAQAIEDEQVRQKVTAFEARRGPLKGLKEIAADPEYLAEWQARSDARPVLPPPGDTITVDLVLADGDDVPMPPEPEGEGITWAEDTPEGKPAGLPDERELIHGPHRRPRSRSRCPSGRRCGCPPTGPRWRSSYGMSARAATSRRFSRACAAASPSPRPGRPSC
jgi:hypothetical protein